MHDIEVSGNTSVIKELSIFKRKQFFKNFLFRGMSCIRSLEKVNQYISQVFNLTKLCFCQSSLDLFMLLKLFYEPHMKCLLGVCPQAVVYTDYTCGNTSRFIYLVEDSITVTKTRGQEFRPFSKYFCYDRFNNKTGCGVD